MVTLIAEAAAPAAPSTELALIIDGAGLDEAQAAILTAKFSDYFALASEWAEKAKALTVTAENQTAEMKMAREGRLFLRGKRLTIEDTRKALKEASLREGRAIDAVAAQLKALIEPTEKYLQEQETFAVRAAAERREKLRAQRHEALAPYTADPSVYALADLSEEAFTELLNGLLAAKEAREENERKAVAERQAAAEAERVRQQQEAAAREAQRQENERLRAEAAAREKQLAAERAKAKREREAAQAKQRAAEAEAKKQRDLAAQLQREQAEREAAAERQRQAEAAAVAEAARKAAAAPDREKLLALAEVLGAVTLPELATAEAQQIIADVRGLIGKVNSYIHQKAEQL